MKKYYIEKNNCFLRYHDFPGNDIPIMFIHGRILVDLLGAGYSDKPDDFTYTVDDHAEYLAEFVSSIGLKSFILFGHSLGGAVAISLATKCREGVVRIILSESNLDKSGEGSTSKYIAEYDMQDFLGNGFVNMVSESCLSYI